VALVQGAILPVADGVETERIDPQLGEVPLGDLGSLLAEQQVVLLGTSFVAVPGDLDVGRAVQLQGIGEGLELRRGSIT
jgi:hypothetical protein